MANAASTVIRVAIKAWPLLVKHWPKVVVAFGALAKFIEKNPQLPARLKDLLVGVPQRVVDVQRRGSEAARIRGTLEIVRDVAREAAGADRATVDADSYLRRADGIERGVRLAESQDRAERKRTLADLRAQTDALLATLIEDVAGSSREGGQRSSA